MSLDRLTSTGVIAVIRGINPAKVLQVIDSVVKGGITAIEITIDSEDAFTLIQKTKEEFGMDIIVGAGTVLDGTSTRSAIKSGASFIVAPTLNEETIAMGRRHGVDVIPGVMTPTEMLQAMEIGADAVKVFPASVLGPSFIKDVKGPLAHIPIITTGGINIDNLGDFIRSGAMAVGVGGSLLNAKLIEENKWSELTQLAKQYVEKVEEARA
ncbi:bifunctional 4-hydroxy-2-oxoglutarate aldolase/2-dehydro-3-deoxy-phosphogluconate aldolase [Virgibacillus natechei]